jgi:hypothetical protein
LHVVCAQRAEHFIERRARGLRAAGNILKDALAAGLLESVHLQIEATELRLQTPAPLPVV